MTRPESGYDVASCLYYSRAPTFAAGLVKISDCEPGWLLVKNP